MSCSARKEEVEELNGGSVRERGSEEEGGGLVIARTSLISKM